jgi:hypothetical protein
VHITRCRHFLHCEGVEISFDVMALDAAAPLMLALDGDAIVLPIAMTVKLGAEVSRGDTHHWYTRSSRCMSSRWHMHYCQGGSADDACGADGA